MSILELDRNQMSDSGHDAKFFADVPFLKSPAKDGDGKPTGAIELRGYASTWVKDRDEEWIDPAAFDRSLAAYLQKNPIILWQHDMEKPIGVMKEAFIDEFGLNVVAEVPKPSDKSPDWKWHAYESITRGIVKTFSIGGIFTRDFVMGREVIKEIELLEVSVVSIPSNPESIFEAAVKAVKGESKRPRLNQGHVKQMRQLIGIDAISEPELLMMSAAEKVARYEELATAYKRAGLMPPAIDEWKSLEPRVFAAKAADGADHKAFLGLTDEIIAVTKKVNGGLAIDEKRGRTVSKNNEEKLRAALGVLDEAEKQIDTWAEQAKTIVGNAKSEIDVVLKQVDGDDEEPELEPGKEADDGIGDAVRRAGGEE